MSERDSVDGKPAGPPLAPIIWLLGKVQSGKSSVIRALTGAPEAEIGSGFKPCTRASVIFDFPSDARVVRFLDTRGLGEAGYDPADDIAFCEARAHLVVVTMRAMDQAQGAVTEALTEIRQRHPDWPIVFAQTTLHEGYETRPPRHIEPYPFDREGLPSTTTVPTRLARSLAMQRTAMAALPGTGATRFVPIDFTRPEDDLPPVDYGLSALATALVETAPLALEAALAGGMLRSRDARARDAHARIVRHAIAAAASDLVPVAGMVAVPGVQASMLRSLGTLYGVDWNRRTALELAGALGTGTIISQLGGFGLRQAAKLIPVWGQTAGAAAASAASFAATYALGKAAAHWLGRRHLGQAASTGVLETYKAALAEAFSMARRQRGEGTGQPKPATGSVQ